MESKTYRHTNIQTYKRVFASAIYTWEEETSKNGVLKTIPSELKIQFCCVVRGNPQNESMECKSTKMNSFRMEEKNTYPPTGGGGLFNVDNSGGRFLVALIFNLFRQNHGGKYVFYDAKNFFGPRNCITPTTVVFFLNNCTPLPPPPL